jgi:hypothetical protein
VAGEVAGRRGQDLAVFADELGVEFEATIEIAGRERVPDPGRRELELE